MIRILHFIKPRQFGKTWDCIDRSAKVGSVIVAKDRSSKEHIKQVAKHRGLTIPDPVIAKDLADNPTLVPIDTKIIVDDADMILMSLLHRDIDVISMVQRDPDGTESMSNATKHMIGVDSDLSNDDIVRDTIGGSVPSFIQQNILRAAGYIVPDYLFVKEINVPGTKLLQFIHRATKDIITLPAIQNER